MIFWQGIILGLSIAAPIGPIGVLCIRRTLANGMLNGFVSGLGAATADGIYGCVAALGITVVSSFLVDNQVYLRLIGGLFLLYLGYQTFVAVITETTEQAETKSHLQSYTSAFFLTLTNPLTVMSFAAIFAGVGIGTAVKGYLPACLLVFGIFTGSMLWWLILSGAVNRLRVRFDAKRLKWVNQLSGIIIAGFGAVSLATIIL